jgi:hypothetical protein
MSVRVSTSTSWGFLEVDMVCDSRTARATASG